MFATKNKNRKLITSSLLSVYVFALFIGLLGASMPTASAAVATQVTELKAACASFGINGTPSTNPNANGNPATVLPASELHLREEACQTGFAAAVQPGAKAPPKTPNATNVLSNVCYASTFKGDLPKAFICFTGYQKGWAQRSTFLKLPATAADIPPAAAKADATKAAATKACDTSTPTDGIVTGTKDALPSCIAGFIGAANGKTVAKACANLKGTALQSCKAGFGLQAKVAASNNANGNANVDSPDCQSGGDPLNWILCPIFDGVAGFADWLFTSVVEPLLKTTPVSTDPDSVAYQSWSSFRVYANVLIVIALLVVVFGQSVGGGLVDAYTAKKVLPRLLVAAVLINLSIYIVAAMVDITNIIGGSIGSVMTAPLKNAGAFVITPSGVQAGTIIAGTAATGTIAAVALSVASLVNLPIFSFFLLFIILPAVLGMLMAFVTLIMRQAIILALVMVAPVAFAMYCLPNTEKYFKKWWDFLLQTLLVYPIVIIFFAVSDILSVTVFQSGGGPLAAVISFVLQFLPLVLLPYAFKLAGGAIAQIHAALSSASKRSQEGLKGNVNDPNSLRNRVKRKAGAGVIRARAQSFRNLNTGKGVGDYKGTQRLTRGIKGSIGKQAPGFAALLTGGAPAAESNLIEAAKQRINKIKDNGDDSVVNARASFLRKDADGQTRRYTLDEKPVSDLEYKAAMQQHPTLGELQAVSEYRLGKVTNSEQGERFARNYGMMAQQQGLTLEEANGNLKGFTFGKQNEAGHLKYGTLDENFQFHGVGDNRAMQRKLSSDGVTLKPSITDDFISEQYYRKSGYTAAQQTAPYWHSTGKAQQQYLERLKSAPASGPMTQEQQMDYDKVKQIIEGQNNFETPSLSRGDDGQPIPAGLGNASPATKAAFEQVKAMRNDPAYQPIVQRIEAELVNSPTHVAQTYESEHSSESRKIK